MKNNLRPHKNKFSSERKYFFFRTKDSEWLRDGSVSFACCVVWAFTPYQSHKHALRQMREEW